MADHQIEVDGVIIDIIRKPIKNMHLRIYPPDGNVRVSAPLRLSINHIRTQIEAKRIWIHTQRARLKSQPLKQELILQTGEQHFFLGQAYTLLVVNNVRSADPIIINNELILYTKPNASLADRKAILKKWHQQQMQTSVPILIKKWEKTIGVAVSNWGSRAMTSRWGSCNTRTRKIWLNLSLIQKPILCLEYVIVHELVHLLEASHNSRFYQLMDKFMPDWHRHKKMLVDTTCN